MSAPGHAPGSIDAEAIRACCATVFGYLDGFVPIRLLAESGTPDRKPWLEFPKIDDVADRLAAIAARAADEQRGVFVVPGTVAQPGSAKAADIVQSGVVVIDLDHGDIAAKREHLVRHIGQPTLEIASGGVTDEGQPKLHLYWRLTEAAIGDDLRCVAGLRATLAAKAGGDPSVGRLHQPIRVAGTIHGKNGRQSPVRLLAHRSVEYDLTELGAAIAEMPARPGTAPGSDAGPSGHSVPTARDLATRMIHAGGGDGATRFEALSSVIGHWIRNVRTGICSEVEAWAAVLDHNVAMIRPPWPEDRLQRDFAALLKRDIANHGPMPGESPGDLDVAHGLTPESDDALAAAFVARHGREWRHVSPWGAWYRWTGKRWQRDETGQVRELVRRVSRVAAQQAEQPPQARRIASQKTMVAVLRIAATDPRISAHPSDWDADPMLLNTPQGIVDLATGAVMPHDPGRLMTQITAAAPGTGCPRWRRFLDQITHGNRDLQAYLQRLAGYCLSGRTTEQVFAFLYGGGANGKSVFLGTLAAVMGDYAATATLDTFMASPGNRHLTEQAGLRAARLVLVPETEADRSWAEARIKTITGSEKIRANFMRQDFFEFTPQCKLLVAGNHRPALAHVGEAMRRRLHLVPFTVTIPAEQRDRDLSAKLLTEADGILGWMLEGCAEWQRIGLAPPSCVADAAAEYFAAEDLVGQWIEECCSLGSGLGTTARELFGSWSAWAEAAGVDRGSQKTLGNALGQRGLVQRKTRQMRGWRGIALRNPGLRGEDDVS